MTAMTPWSDLTNRGQLRRLRRVASAAMAHYPLEVRKLRLIGGFTNALFRIDAAERVCAIRVDYHEDHSDEDVNNELAWLEALAGDTDLDVVRPIRTTDGHRYVYATAPGVPGPRRCTLFGWVPGVPLADRCTATGYAALGRLAAGLHVHGASHIPPSRPMAWDRVFYWPASVDPVVVYRPEHENVFSGNRRSVFDRAMDLVATAFSRLDPAQAQVLHGDLHPWNVHVCRSRLIALDFEDIMWGHGVQDVAITLFYERSNPDYPALRSAFEEGYVSVAPWPATYDGEVEHFMAARTLMFINYVMNLHDDPSEFHDPMFARLEQFIDRWG